MTDRAGQQLREGTRVAPETTRAPRLFGRRRWVLERENRRLRSALREVMQTMTSEIDPEPRPWCAYSLTDEGNRTLSVEQSAWLADVEPNEVRRSMMHWPTPRGKVELWIDDLRYVVDPGKYTGDQVRHVAHPPIGENRDLYLVRPNPWDADLLVRDGDEVHVQDGVAFITAPRFINAG